MSASNNEESTQPTAATIITQCLTSTEEFDRAAWQGGNKSNYFK